MEVGGYKKSASLSSVLLGFFFTPSKIHYVTPPQFYFWPVVCLFLFHLLFIEERIVTFGCILEVFPLLLWQYDEGYLFGIFIPT